MGYSINTLEYHYIEWYTWDNIMGTKGDFVASELYNSIDDPDETSNIADHESYQMVVEKLSQQLVKGWRSAQVEL